MPRERKNARSVVFHEKIRKTAKRNSFFRKVIYAGRFSELAVMSVAPYAELGEEVHKHIDEILFVIKGRGKVILNGRTHKVRPHDAVFVAAGEDHNLKNIGRKDLKLICVCSPPSSTTTAGIHRSGEKALEERMRYAWEQ